MIKRYSTKIKNGKLVIIKIEIVNNKISSFQLLGDFFLHPEEKIELIEKSAVSLDQKQAAAAIKKTIEKEGITLLGFSVDDIISLMDLAFSEKDL